MKIKQFIFIEIALGGLIVLFLAGLGFLTQDPPQSPGPGTSEGAGNASSAHAVVEGVETKGPGWKLSAASATISEEMGYDLSQPVLEITYSREGDEGDKHDITITAERGSQKSLQDPLVKLSGNVVVQIKSAQENALLTTESLVVDLEKKVAATESAVVFRVNREGADNVITGRKARYDGVAQTLTIEEDVELVLEGVPDLLSAGPVEQEAEQKKVLITCEGGLVHEGLLYRTTLTRNVRAVSGEDSLHADKMEVYFSPEDQGIRKTVAQGNVRFAGPTGRASADKFVQSAGGGILLTGEPDCYFERGTYRIDGAQLEINPRLGTISVPGPGSLEGAAGTGEEAGDTEDMRIDWEGGLLFDQNLHLAIIKQNVVAVVEGNEARCETLVLRFNDENSNIVSWEASEDAVITVPVTGTGGDLEELWGESTDKPATSPDLPPESD